MKKTIGALLILLFGVYYILEILGYGEFTGIVPIFVMLICDIIVVTYFTSGTNHRQTGGRIID